MNIIRFDWTFRWWGCVGEWNVGTKEAGWLVDYLSL